MAMVTDTYCCIFRNYTLEASTVQVSERALGLTVWIKKLARSNNQAFGPFDGVFPLLSLNMEGLFLGDALKMNIYYWSSRMLIGVPDPQLHQLLYFLRGIRPISVRH